MNKFAKFVDKLLSHLECIHDKVKLHKCVDFMINP